MKLRHRLPFKSFFKKLRSHQRGQAMVEYVLLLAAVCSISYAFVSVMNRNISVYWQHTVNLIINDKTGTNTAKID